MQCVVDFGMEKEDYVLYELCESCDQKNILHCHEISIHIQSLQAECSALLVSEGKGRIL